MRIVLIPKNTIKIRSGQTSGAETLKLEVDERLDFGRFDLHDSPDQDGDDDGLRQYGGGGNDPFSPGFGRFGQQVQQEPDGHQSEDRSVTGNHLRDQRGIEMVEYLGCYQRDAVHVLCAEHDPAETDDVERDDDTDYPRPSF